ncbi:MAG TPA: alpha/beta hydrolase [Thermoanaerobaculia bacterium]|jgi:predicted esterase|nr:alpha/beta hydrolase [Thermoanaerobaculia bacterium]
MTIHRGQPVLATGRPLADADAAMVLVHGRGGSAEDILGLAAELNRPELAYLAPQAAGHTWYPNRFLAPLAQNEPGLSSGLEQLGALVAHLEQAGIPAERIVLLGFSQGACLSLEFAARNAKRYGGVVALSGGLIGPPGTPRDYPGAFNGTPVFLGCSDRDPHIPKDRVDESAKVFERMGAAVTERIYPGMGHTINEDELDFVRGLLAPLVTAAV